MSLNDETSCPTRTGSLAGFRCLRTRAWILAVLCVYSASPAVANNRAYRTDFFSLNSFLLVPIVLLLTWAANAYPILRVREEGKSKRVLVVVKTAAVLSVLPLFVAAMMAIPLVAIPVFWWAGARAINLIWWGWTKWKKGASAPDFLRQANPIRLMVPGVCLIAAMIWIIQYFDWPIVPDPLFIPSLQNVIKQVNELNAKQQLK